MHPLLINLSIFRQFSILCVLKAFFFNFFFSPNNSLHLGGVFEVTAGEVICAWSRVFLVCCISKRRKLVWTVLKRTTL